MKNYVVDHSTYVNNSNKNAKCAVKLSKTLDVSEALEHMLICPRKIDSSGFFQKIFKLCKPVPGKSVYSRLSENFHQEISSKVNVVNVPEWLEPIEKRSFLLLARGFNDTVGFFSSYV